MDLGCPLEFKLLVDFNLSDLKANENNSGHECTSVLKSNQTIKNLAGYDGKYMIPVSGR